MIKDYIIKSRLGIGSYGTVYKVCKKNTNKIYVIKQVSLLGLGEKEIMEYKSEAKLLSSIKSNYVVKYFDSFIDNHNLNILMEYCDGGDLYQYLEKNKKKKIKLKEKIIWQIFIQMIIGLNSIHKKKILHRDIKSQNIFLTKNLDIKIGDLGVSKKLIQTNFAKTFIGTPYYLSPEICMEKPYNDKSDIWAIGCILYELCTFNYPFNAKSQGALLLKILNNEPEKIDNNYYSKDLQNMINLLLNKNYELRPSCADILKMKIILDKAKKYNLINDIMNECDSNNINNNLLNKKISFKGNKKENNIPEKQINIKSKNNNKIYYFDCNEEKPKQQKNNNITNNKIIKEALTKIMRKQSGKKGNIISLINNALQVADNNKKEKNIIINNNNKIKYNKSKEKITKDFNTEERINHKEKKIDMVNIDKLISIDDNILKENSNKLKSKNIKEFADNLNSYVSKYKTSEIKEKKVVSKIYKENISPINKKEKRVEINLDKNKYINNNINININNDLNNNNANILNSIMNFKIINNNDSDIHININNNSNILNTNNKSTISLDNNNNDNNELYSEEENSEEQKEFVKEIKENNIYDINSEIKILKEKISKIKDDMLKLIGGIDYNYIMNLYNNINDNDNMDNAYEKIENFVNKYYDTDKKDSFNNLYYQLISLNHNLNKKEKGSLY